jgi:hypothetical protein
MSQKRSGYKKLGINLVSLEEKIYRMPKRPLMVGEKKYDGTRDPFKMLLEEALMQQRNKMIDSFMQILWQIPTSDIIFLKQRLRPLKGTNQL